MKICTILVLLSALFYYPTIKANQNKAIGQGQIPVITHKPNEEKVYPIGIIGAGAAGIMALKRAILNNDEVLIFTGAKQERRGSRGNWVKKVDNIPGLAKYERTVVDLRNEVLEELSKGSFRHNLYIIDNSITSIKKENEIFKLSDGMGQSYFVKYLILATGIMDEQPKIQGSIREILPFANGQTVAYCTLCDGHRSFGKKTVLIGHSESAAKMALALVEKYKIASMTILTNGQKPQFNQEVVKRINDHHIMVLEAPIQEVMGNKEAKQLTGFKLQNGKVVEAEMGYVALGIRPNNQLALQLGATVENQGLVVTDSNGETNIPNLFVVGDLRANSMKQIYTAWQHAVESVQVINRRIRE